jgi:hypothetical protein
MLNFCLIKLLIIISGSQLVGERVHFSRNHHILSHTHAQTHTQMAIFICRTVRTVEHIQLFLFTILSHTDKMTSPNSLSLSFSLSLGTHRQITLEFRTTFYAFPLMKWADEGAKEGNASPFNKSRTRKRSSCVFQKVLVYSKKKRILWHFIFLFPGKILNGSSWIQI